MHRITRDSLATINWSLKWQSPEASHEERWLARRVNFWRDIFPPGMLEALLGKTRGDTVALEYEPHLALPCSSRRNVLELHPRQLRRIQVAGRSIPLHEGRFYPRRVIVGEPFVLPEDMRPFRLLERSDTRAVADLNHPMADRACRLQGDILQAAPKTSDTGGQLFDWVETIIDYGPGMQCRHKGRPTTFCGHYPYERSDSRPDSEFYAQPRLINHVDSQASEHLAAEYGRHLTPGMRVLDLMSSQQSHLPPELPQDVRVTGLGLNMEELEANPHLQERVVADLNQEPVLPFAADLFSLALCSLSVEYLVDPLAVFADVRRVLAPGGRFLVGFSDRWFPTKVAGCWPDLHPFERMGLVLDFFLQSEGFEDLRTVSIRNWWRPGDDPYYGQLSASDPVFIVSGKKC